MGVCLVAYSLSDANIAEVLADPPLIWRVIESDNDSSYLRELGHAAKLSIFDRLLGKPKPVPVIRNLNFTEDELRIVDLDKSWDGLNACLKVCAAQAPNFFEDAGQVGKIEVGYGAALYHRSETMNAIAQAYAELAGDDLKAVYRSLNLADVYPSGLWRQQDPEIESYLLENFVELKAFVRYTQEHALGAIIQLT